MSELIDEIIFQSLNDQLDELRGSIDRISDTLVRAENNVSRFRAELEEAEKSRDAIKLYLKEHYG